MPRSSTRRCWLGWALRSCWSGRRWCSVRYCRADGLTRASIRQASRIRHGWKRLARMAGLSVTDRTPTLLAELTAKDGHAPKPRVLTPKITTKPDRFGVVVSATCLPKVGLEEYNRAARFLADAWARCGCRSCRTGPARCVCGPCAPTR